MASVAKKAKLKKTVPQPCPYGASCYRKNPAHLAEFSHHKTDDGGTSSSSSSAASKGDKNRKASIDTSSLPPCSYGAKCYRKNLLHFAEFSHPMSASAKADDDDADDDDEGGGDTDVYDSDDDKATSKASPSKASDNKVLNRGMSLVKSFTKMTEQERRDLIRMAFEAKQQLQEELDATKKQVEKKDKELNQLQEKARLEG